MKGKMKATKTIYGIIALTTTLAVAQSLSAADVLQSPRAAANQTRRVSSAAADQDLAHNAGQELYQSPRAQANQAKVSAGSAASDRDYAHNRSLLFSGKDQARDQYARYLKSTGKDTYQLAPVK